MENSADSAKDRGTFLDKVRPFWEKIRAVCGKVSNVIRVICQWIYRLRGLFMAIPVAYFALKLASFNAKNLPEQVGLNLLSTGEFAMMVERSTAVNGPLAVTAACLVLTLCSRRNLQPWIISIFTLVLPILILALNNFDGLLLLFGL